jgi:hypothetical protein
MSRPEDDEQTATCTECHSDQNLQRLIKNPFFQSGQVIPCQFCGGAVMIVDKDRRKNALRQSDRKRGVPKQD